jgi:hypothetical protein
MGEDGKVRMSPATPDEIREMNQYITANREGDTAFDIVVEGQTPGDDPGEDRKIIEPYTQAGATWWIEAMWNISEGNQVLERIKQGPPPSV